MKAALYPPALVVGEVEVQPVQLEGREGIDEGQQLALGREMPCDVYVRASPPQGRLVVDDGAREVPGWCTWQRGGTPGIVRQQMPDRLCRIAGLGCIAGLDRDAVRLDLEAVGLRTEAGVDADGLLRELGTNGPAAGDHDHDHGADRGHRRTGDFSAKGIPALFDPLTTTAQSNGVYGRTAFPGNLIPANRQNQAAINLENLLFPLPTNGNLTNNYIASVPRATDYNQYNARLDHRFSDRDQLFVRFSDWNRKCMAPAAPCCRRGPAGNGRPLRPLSATHSPSLRQPYWCSRLVPAVFRRHAPADVL